MQLIFNQSFFKKQFVLSCLLLTACLQSTSVVNADQPDWVNGASSQYPNSHYVLASGSASNGEQAKDRALANLSKVFELRIRESSTTRQDTRVLIKNGSESVNKSQRVMQNINIQTNKIIDGARVAEQWKSEDLTYYALAVLDRRQAGNNIREIIARLDKDAEFDLASVDAKPSPLQKVAVYQRVLNLQDERAALQKTLKVIDLSGQGSVSRWSRAELREKLEISLLALNMRPAVSQGAATGLAQLLKGAMSKSGFPESKDSIHGYVLSAGLELQPAFQQQDWYWLRGTLSLNLTSSEGKVLGNKTWPLKVSASRKTQLKQRMMTKVEKKLNQELKSTIMGFSGEK